MNATVFNRLRRIVYDEAGIRLQDGKEAMVASRIAQRLRKLSLPDEAAYLEHLERETASELVELLDVISTNVTHFYREPQHFTALRSWLTQWSEAGQSRFRMWCAASSTGEEPYTLAFTFAEALGLRPTIDWRILATDISTRVLRHAQEGIYREEQLAGVPAATKKAFVTKVRQEPGRVRVRDDLRARLVFRRLNLAKPPFPMGGPLDAVFCRNVMIYFDDPVRRALLGEFRRLLRPGGFLVVGLSEGLVGFEDGFVRRGGSIYERVDD